MTLETIADTLSTTRPEDVKPKEGQAWLDAQPSKTARPILPDRPFHGMDLNAYPRPTFPGPASERRLSPVPANLVVRVLKMLIWTGNSLR